MGSRARKGSAAKARGATRPTDGAAPPADLVGLRLRSARLIGAPFASPEEAVRWFGAVQAQDYAGAKWAVGLRTAGCNDADVDRAVARGAVVRTHVLRPTWHFVAADDVRWMLALSAPRIRAANRPYERATGLDEAVVRRSQDVLREALAGGRHRTRDELARALAGSGIEAAGLRLALLLMRAELDAVICSGPRRGKHCTYALFDERVPARPALARDEALPTLALRYFASHGPATAQDFAWWSGLKAADAAAAVRLATHGLAAETRGGKTYWSAARTTGGAGGADARTAAGPRAAAPRVHLLPNYDEYVVAYRDRGAFFDAARWRPSGARTTFLASHAVLLDGRVVGAWRRTLARDVVHVEVELFAGRLAAEAGRALEEAAHRYGRFLGLLPRLSRRRSGPPRA